MDADAFLPWLQEDLESGPEFAKRVLGLIPLVDDTINSGVADKFLETTGRIALRYEGYGRHIQIVGVKAWFGFILDGWAQHGTTPLWLLFTYDEYERLQEAGLAETQVVKWRTKDGRYCIPIEFPTGVEYDATLDSVVASLKGIAEQLSSTAPSQSVEPEQEQHSDRSRSIGEATAPVRSPNPITALENKNAERMLCIPCASCKQRRIIHSPQ